MDERFLESIVHRRAPLLARLRGCSGHVVLGRRLRPYSFWHQQLLRGIDSPFLSAWTVKPTSIQLFKNLFLATSICRLTPFNTRARVTWLDVRARKLAVARFYIRPGWLRPGRRYLRLLIEAAKFRAYVADYTSVAIPFPTRHSKPVQTPVNLYQLELYRRFHPEKSARQVWAMSPGEISWENTAAQEAHGAEVSIYTEARMEADAIARRGGKVQNNGNGHERR